MRKIRVFVDAPFAAGERVPLPPFSAEHLTRVLRLADGAAVTCFNGDGYDYAATLRTRGKATVIELGERGPAPPESPLAITLVQSVARGEKMDFILQKATELGVARIVPVVSERTEVRLDEDRADKRRVHWQRVVESACEQCGRARIPPVDAATSLARYAEAAQRESGAKLVLHPEGGPRLGELEAVDAITVAVGPEGGWSDRDLSMFATAGFERLALGPRILRTETAGIAAIAMLQSRFGDLA